MKKTNFYKDLLFGQSYEKEALKYFKFKEFKISEGNFKPYDIELIVKDDKKMFIEVKCDRMAHRTGNIAIEYECNNIPSGINTTQAHKWIYFIEESKEVFIIPVKKLRSLINGCRQVSGGDGFRSKMYLLPKNTLGEFNKSYIEKN